MKMEDPVECIVTLKLSNITAKRLRRLSYSGSWDYQPPSVIQPMTYGECIGKYTVGQVENFAVEYTDDIKILRLSVNIEILHNEDLQPIYNVQLVDPTNKYTIASFIESKDATVHVISFLFPVVPETA